ncbi:MAG: neuraminidase, partial [Pedobacter sp.]
MFKKYQQILLICSLLIWVKSTNAQETNIQTIADNGWAKNTVNTVVFRKNSLTTFQNTQYASYYDDEQFVVLAKRNIANGKWEVERTQYKGDATDAHKSISIIVDGDGFLHIAWGQHGNNLNYAKSLAPNSLKLGVKESMLRLKENKVSYPEFYNLKNGDLLFSYRDGSSGNGGLMMNKYDIKTKKWHRLQDNLI